MNHTPNFDLNFHVLSDEEEFLFDLNTTPLMDDGNFIMDDGNFIMDDDREFGDDLVFEDDQNEDTVDAEEDQVAHLHGSRKHITNEQRWAIYGALLERSIGGKLKTNTTRQISELFSVHIVTVQHIWRQAKQTGNDGSVNVSDKRLRNSGRKKIALDLNQIATIPLHKRTTLRSLSIATDISLGTLHRRFKQGKIRRHTNAIKPSLKDENMKSRLQFCFSMLDKDSLVQQPKFVDMYNTIHIDEKWFYMTKKTEKYYLTPTEEEPYRSCQSKNFIVKVMFLAAMARPRFDDDGNETFSGKIGVFPFVTSEPAKRRSKNRNAETLELKASTSVKREDIKAYLIEKVIPIIHERWPKEDRGKTIFIQQDNARPHVDCSDKEFQEAASKNGFDIRLMCQPPNSPDLNILDLGYFSAIQSLQHKTCPKTVEDLALAVEKSYDEFSAKKVNRIFLTLQTCMVEIMKVGGSNKYKTPHMKKSTLEREGRLPIQINCDASLVQNVMITLGLSD